MIQARRIRLRLELIYVYRCIYNHGAVGTGERRTFYCENVITGRFVYITLRAEEQLTLCEVEVFKANLGKVYMHMYICRCIYALSYPRIFSDTVASCNSSSTQNERLGLV